MRLIFLPAPWDTLFQLIPLQYLAFFPAAIFLGKVQGPELVHGLLIEIGWVVFFILVSRVALRRGMNRYSGYGG